MVKMFELGPTPADPMDLLAEPISMPQVHLYNGDKGQMIPWISKNTSLGRVLVPSGGIPNQPDIPIPGYTGFIKADIPTMSQAVLNTATAFFRFVLETSKTEAALLLALDEENNYHLYCPEQEVEYSGVDWKDDVELEEGHYLMGSIHSHCDFSAFHSGTDTGDAAKNDGLHLTLGKLDEDVPEVDVMVSFSGVRWEKWELSDFLEGKEWKPFKADDGDQHDLWDAEWLDKLTEARKWVTYGYKSKGKVIGKATHQNYSGYGGYGDWEDDDWELDGWEDDGWGHWGEYHHSKKLPGWDKSTDDRDVHRGDIGGYKRINRESSWYSENQDMAQDQIIKDICDLVLLASEVGMTINFSVQHREGNHADDLGDMTPLLPETTTKEGDTTDAHA